ncbi:MAG TPA: cytochrome C oxidase subunit IV family protein [Pirellulaceae bacterium]|jgi:cytochrome c oxidase subunit 4|nr:cytochrome C oxidase subunit IV family protein [Pirellulaceae bacterium]
MATSAQSSPHGSLKTYLSVFIALCVLTGISFAVANSQALMANPSVGWSLMMAVSAGKALLVVLFFMHLKYEANWKYVLTIPTLGMAAFLVIALGPDIGARTAQYSEERWLQAAQPLGEPAPELAPSGMPAATATEPPANVPTANVPPADTPAP